MPNPDLSYGTAPSILLVEPGISGQSDRVLQLAKSKYRVARAEDSAEIFSMRAACTFSVAVLSDAVGSSGLRSSAQVVRGHWPKARILILGSAPAQFEDHLYDDAMVQGSSEAALLARVLALSEEYWACRGESIADWAGSLNRVAGPAIAWSESDPNKASSSLFLTEDTRNWATSVRRFRESRLG